MLSHALMSVLPRRLMSVVGAFGVVLSLIAEPRLPAGSRRLALAVIPVILEGRRDRVVTSDGDLAESR